MSARRDTAPGSSPANTVPETPAVDPEATAVAPPPRVPDRKSVLPQRSGPGKGDPEDDDEATRATGVPKKVREVQRILQQSKILNEQGGPKKPRAKLHPLIPIGVALALLAVALLLVNWALSNGPAGEGEGPSRIRSLFDW